MKAKFNPTIEILSEIAKDLEISEEDVRELLSDSAVFDKNGELKLTEIDAAFNPTIEDKRYILLVSQLNDFREDNTLSYYKTIEIMKAIIMADDEGLKKIYDFICSPDKGLN